jgi:hypothetical protein
MATRFVVGIVLVVVGVAAMCWPLSVERGGALLPTSDGEVHSGPEESCGLVITALGRSESDPGDDGGYLPCRTEAMPIAGMGLVAGVVGVALVYGSRSELRAWLTGARQPS